jgi:hypothetical protein
VAELHIITGAPGAGKSTLRRQLARYPFGTVDFDELPDPDGSLLGIDIRSPAAGAVWPAYNRLWVKVAAMMLRAGSPILVLCPVTPAEWAGAISSAVDLPRPAWARLDCTDANRRARLAARGWAGGRIEDAVRDARELRLVVEREFSSDGAAVETAAAVAHWILDDPHADRG